MSVSTRGRLPSILGEQKGIVATIERADIDQLQLDPEARWQRSRLFMMHAPFDYYATENNVINSNAGEPAAIRQPRLLRRLRRPQPRTRRRLGAGR